MRRLAVPVFLLLADFLLAVFVVKDLGSNSSGLNAWQQPHINPLVAAHALPSLQTLGAQTNRSPLDVLCNWLDVKTETWQVFFAGPRANSPLESLIRGPFAVSPTLDVWTFAAFHHCLPVIYLATLLAVFASHLGARDARRRSWATHAVHLAYVQISAAVANLPTSLVVRALGSQRTEPSITFLQTLHDPLKNWPARVVLNACLKLPLAGYVSRGAAHTCTAMDAVVLLASATGMVCEAAWYARMDPRPSYAVPWAWTVPLQAFAASALIWAVNAYILCGFSPANQSPPAGSESSGGASASALGPPVPPTDDSSRVRTSARPSCSVSSLYNGGKTLSKVTSKTMAAAPASASYSVTTVGMLSCWVQKAAAHARKLLRPLVYRVSATGSMEGRGASSAPRPAAAARYSRGGGAAPATLRGQVAIHLPDLEPGQLPEEWLEQLKAQLAITHPRLRITGLSVWKGSTHVLLDCELDGEGWDGEDVHLTANEEMAVEEAEVGGQWVQGCQLRFSALLRAVATAALQVMCPLMPAAAAAAQQVDAASHDGGRASCCCHSSASSDWGSSWSLRLDLDMSAEADRAPCRTAAPSPAAAPAGHGLQGCEPKSLVAHLRIQVDKGTGIVVLYDWCARRRAWRVITQLPRPADAPALPFLCQISLSPRVFSLAAAPAKTGSDTETQPETAWDDAAAGPSVAASSSKSLLPAAPVSCALRLTLRCLHADLLRVRCVMRWEALPKGRRGRGGAARQQAPLTPKDVGVWGCQVYPSLLDLPGADVRPADGALVQAAFPLPVDAARAPRGPCLLWVELYDADTHVELLAAAPALHLPGQGARLLPVPVLGRPRCLSHSIRRFSSMKLLKVWATPGLGGMAARPHDGQAAALKACAAACLQAGSLGAALWEAVLCVEDAERQDVSTVLDNGPQGLDRAAQRGALHSDTLLAAVGRWARQTWETQTALEAVSAAADDAQDQSLALPSFPSAGDAFAAPTAAMQDRSDSGMLDVCCPAALRASASSAADALAASLRYGAWPVARCVLDTTAQQEATRAAHMARAGLLTDPLRKRMAAHLPPLPARVTAELRGVAAVARVLERGVEVYSAAAAVGQQPRGGGETDGASPTTEDATQAWLRLTPSPRLSGTGGQETGVEQLLPTAQGRMATMLPTEVLPVALVAMRSGHADTALSLEAWLEAHGLSFPWATRYALMDTADAPLGALAHSAAPMGHGPRVVHVHALGQAARCQGLWWALGAYAGSLMRRGGPTPLSRLATRHAARMLSAPHRAMTWVQPVVAAIPAMIGLRYGLAHIRLMAFSLLWILPYVAQGLFHMGGPRSRNWALSHAPGINTLAALTRVLAFCLTGSGVTWVCTFTGGAGHYNAPMLLLSNVLIESCLVHLLEPVSADVWPWLVVVEGAARTYMHMGVRRWGMCSLPRLSLMDLVMRSAVVTAAVYAARRCAWLWALRHVCCVGIPLAPLEPWATPAGARSSSDPKRASGA